MKQLVRALFNTPYRCFALLLQLVSFCLTTGLVEATPTTSDPSATRHLLADETIAGTIIDETGKGLPGVSIQVKNTTRGASSDADGNYRIVAEKGATLVFSFIGYVKQEVAIGNQTTVNVTMAPDAQALSEVVVVGYGTQKKVNLTGSVATVTAKNIENRPVTNVSSSLAGLAPGVSVRQASGKPGSDGATIRIRGTGTLNNSDALVIIDGVQGSMDSVNPNDIESISILKDAASASIYGSLAANGVILITTKKGSARKTTVTYTGLMSSARPSSVPNFVSDYVRYMRLFNESNRNIGVAETYSDNTIKTWEEANKNPDAMSAGGVPNYVAYPNTDWAKWVFRNEIVQNHNIAVNGGSDKVLYNVSLGYLDNRGVMQNTGLKRYQLRANIESKVTKFLTLGTQTFASTQSAGKANTDNAFNFLWQTNPGIYPYYNGRYGFPVAVEEPTTVNNILGYLDGTGGLDRTTRFNTTLYGVLTLAKGLTLEPKVNYQTRFNEGNSFSLPGPGERWDFSTNTQKVQLTTPDQLSTGYSFNRDYLLTFDNVLRYSTTFGRDHDFGALVGYNQFYFRYYDFSASKRGLIDYNTTTLGSAGETSNTAGGQEYDRALRSFFGRVNYAYQSKYLVEANLRYDGSSKFSPESRWGVFPSFSAGWRISEEPFMRGLNNKIQNLKLRASWGKLGNNASGDYDYQATYGKVPYSFNNIATTGLVQAKFANPLLQWESTTVTDIGLEGVLFKGRMNVEIDLYRRLTDGILTTPPVYLTAGTKTAPTQNTASVLNKGIELTLGWRDKIGPVDFSVSGNVAYNLNRVTNYRGTLSEGYTTDATGSKAYNSNVGQVSSGGDTRVLEGHGINEYYLLDVYRGDGSHSNTDGTPNINGGPTDGMIRTPEDMAWVQAMITKGYKFQPVSTVGKGQLYYGDLIYADLNGDGIYGNNFDKKFTGTNPNPKYTVGLTLSAAWKGFDFSMLWAGNLGMQYLYNQSGVNNTRTTLTNSISTRIADDHYYYNDANTSDPANNTNGKFPRLKNGTDNQTNISSTYWLYDASYVKLKNLQLGYTIPGTWGSRVGLSRARVFVSGENILTLTSYPGLDPESVNISTITNQNFNLSYPTMKQYAVGLNLTF
ncbi:SusC/RagA family TonB-linked outer membrane protein [Spirosoma endophyticum]|uniref:TonB-linked outer membrane protein, SusC/RagA family n=1 Tax=Spirosoma endophyticum TaxID=662367 RepID=A0A1I2DS21_9BACT|nr:TonB-dependent receptor [Spirosoma endophyticum]SFE83061.1 TonB-linked outer membrane protein, SusC/RagA family [Spirosoma endophyticum]